jgi:hypothetical protein
MARKWPPGGPSPNRVQEKFSSFTWASSFTNMVLQQRCQPVTGIANGKRPVAAFKCFFCPSRLNTETGAMAVYVSRLGGKRQGFVL